MKKLIIAAFAVAFAAVAQAATATWNSGTMYYAASAEGGIGTTKIATAGVVNGYYFNISSALYDAITADFSQEAIYKAFDASKQTLTFGAFASVAADKTGTNLATGTLALKDTGTYTTGDTVYGVVIYTYHDSTFDKDMYLANAGKMTYTSTSNKSQNNMANTLGGATQAANNIGWQAVPEPTSGLLLLLGMGALALRRKQA